MAPKTKLTPTARPSKSDKEGRAALLKRARASLAKLANVIDKQAANPEAARAAEGVVLRMIEAAALGKRVSTQKAKREFFRALDGDMQP